MAQTKAPTGLKVTRTGDWFTLNWKIGDADYLGGQYWQYLIVDSGKANWPRNSTRINHNQTAKGVKINPRNYYPYKNNYLYKVMMRVKGDRKAYQTKDPKTKKTITVNPTISTFSTAEFVLQYPLVPSLSVSYDEELSNRCTFSWSYNGGTVPQDSPSFFSDLEWQTILVKNTNQTDGSKLNWKSSQLGWATGTTGASGSRQITEDTDILYKNGDSYARWFRVRARGPRGASAWRYSSRVYAIPHQAQVLSVNAKETAEGGFRCEVSWQVGGSRQYPIDKTLVQYTIVVPEKGLTCPAGVSWTDADISADTSGSDGSVFGIDDQLSLDQCLFIRVNTQHDKKITYGKPVLAAAGYLKDPSTLSVVPDPETHKAEVSVTNTSDVEDSFLAVRFVPSEGDPLIVGIVPHGSDSVIVQCPNWDSLDAYAFDVYAVVGSYQKQTRIDGVDFYSITQLMRSKETLSEGGAVPIAPRNITVNRVENLQDTIRVTWDWTWKQASGAELSWSDHPDAWESTDEPEVYTISNMKASRWNISGLELGKTWYVRVRLFIRSSDDTYTYGPWSDIDAGAIDLSSAPNKPSLVLSNSVIPDDGSVTASWVYVTIDKTSQTYAEIAEVVMEDIELPPEQASQADEIVYDEAEDRNIYIKKERNYDKIIAHTLTAQHIDIDATLSGWEKGQTYNLACRVQSASGRRSEWSDVVSVSIADLLGCEITQTSLVSQSVQETGIDPETSEEVTYTREFLALTEMPLTITVQGAGVSGITSVDIERASSYHLDRPDEGTFHGHEGEVVASKTQAGENQITFEMRDIIGSLDDGGLYKIVATVKDSLGQSAKVTQDFEVHWTHQAVAPELSVSLDKEKLIAKITPLAPEGVIETDTCNVYRLSIDRPELIIEGAQFGETYVDPYPALGELGGYRIVTVTENGDYITSENKLAIIDSMSLENPDFFENDEQLNIIDFDGKQIKFYYDTDYSNTWAKDFQETQYLGGSIQGDWNAAVSRSGTLSSQAITVLDQEMLQYVRRLASYAGICHIRTADGSSYSADVQVSEDRVHDDQEMLANYSLSITRVDSQGFEGMTLAQWEEEQQEDE